MKPKMFVLLIYVKNFDHAPRGCHEAVGDDGRRIGTSSDRRRENIANNSCLFYVRQDGSYKG